MIPQWPGVRVGFVGATWGGGGLGKFGNFPKTRPPCKSLKMGTLTVPNPENMTGVLSTPLLP